MSSKKSEFSREQLCYLHKLLAIEPCHISGMHDPNHHLDGKICNHQRSDAWTRAMKELGLTQSGQRGSYTAIVAGVKRGREKNYTKLGLWMSWCYPQILRILTRVHIEKFGGWENYPGWKIIL